ncbi:glycerate kinase [Algibacter mikhailovii]|uniref:glycerate kinase n=1 Tax=Algibacter mikhailovii TaxID=425498 RepID=UPI0024945C77|nr:glycerate kinase [Algibacter mikhailovii]
MKIVLAPDKFKNSLSALEFCKTVEKGLRSVNPNIEIIKLPLADGGDGTIEVVNFYLKADIIKVKVSNPLFSPILASYLYSNHTETAFIEMAEASGVKLLKSEQLNCKNATTLGTGEMILDAINKGATKIILGIGGSATNDCGIGMATALGYRFLDKNKAEIKPIGANLSNITAIDLTRVDPRLNKVKFSIACDVSNPLYGKNGAAHIYAAQKGASKKDIVMLDQGLRDFSVILEATFGVQVQSTKGAGAAGGMGIASKVFLNGKLDPGIQLIKNLANFDNDIEGADWIITGEGKLDTQTLSGKTIKGVIHSAKTKNIKVAAFCGTLDFQNKSIKDFGIDYLDLIDHYALHKEDAINNGKKYLTILSKKFAETIIK